MNPVYLNGWCVASRTLAENRNPDLPLLALADSDNNREWLENSKLHQRANRAEVRKCKHFHTERK